MCSWPYQFLLSVFLPPNNCHFTFSLPSPQHITIPVPTSPLLVPTSPLLVPLLIIPTFPFSCVILLLPPRSFPVSPSFPRPYLLSLFFLHLICSLPYFISVLSIFLIHSCIPNSLLLTPHLHIPSFPSHSNILPVLFTFPLPLLFPHIVPDHVTLHPHTDAIVCHASWYVDHLLRSTWGRG